MSRPEHNTKHKKQAQIGDCRVCGSETKSRMRVVMSPLNRQLEGTDLFCCKRCLNKYATTGKVSSFLIKRMGLKEFAPAT